MKSQALNKIKTETPVERVSKRKREVKAESKAKIRTETSSKRKQLWRDDSSSVLIEKSLEFDPAFHTKTDFTPGKSIRSLMAGGLFTCTRNTDLIKARENYVYANFKEMQNRLVDQMNVDFGAHAFDIAWREGSKYVSLVCRAKGCPF